MKQLKPFLPGLYSEYLLTAPSTSAEAKSDHLLLGTELGGEKQHDGEGDLRGPGGTGKGAYERVMERVLPQ
jgi:hypothetical protein